MARPPAPEVTEEDLRQACDFVEEAGYGPVADRLRAIVRDHVEVGILKEFLRRAEEERGMLREAIRRRDAALLDHARMVSEPLFLKLPRGSDHGR